MNFGLERCPHYRYLMNLVILQSIFFTSLQLFVSFPVASPPWMREIGCLVAFLIFFHNFFFHNNFLARVDLQGTSKAHLFCTFSVRYNSFSVSRRIFETLRLSYCQTKVHFGTLYCLYSKSKHFWNGSTIIFSHSHIPPGL